MASQGIPYCSYSRNAECRFQSITFFQQLDWLTAQNVASIGIEVEYLKLLMLDVNACYNIESVYNSLRDTGRRPPVFGSPGENEQNL